MPEREEACARLEVVLDTYLSVGAPVQLAIERLFDIGNQLQQSIRRRLQKNLFSSPKLTCFTWKAAGLPCCACLNLMTEEEWITRLFREHRVIVQPGYFFDMPGAAFLVVSLLTEERIFSEGISRLVALLDSEGAL